MLFGNPVRRTIRPDKRFYPTHPDAVSRAAAGHDPLVTQDFGPTGVEVEPTVVWPGGEANIFGRRIRAKTYRNFHRGLDISKGKCDGDILAAARGEVKVSGKTSTGAGIIVIGHGKHGGHRFRTEYGHLASRFVKVGDKVEAGAVIGKLGNTGTLSTGCHLHFAVKKDGRYVDPWRRLRQHATVDPDAPSAPEPVESAEPDEPIEPVVPEDPDDPVLSTEETDMPIPVSDDKYIAGAVATIGNAQAGAIVRTGPDTDADVVRTVPGGTVEEWRPTCWVRGDEAFGSDLWLTRWFNGQWEFTHFVNVASVTGP